MSGRASSQFPLGAQKLRGHSHCLDADESVMCFDSLSSDVVVLVTCSTAPPDTSPRFSLSLNLNISMTWKGDCLLAIEDH